MSVWKRCTIPSGPAHQRSLELRGHILDSLTLSAALDDVLAMGGDYCIDGMEIGHRKENPSRVSLVVGAATEEQLRAILTRLKELGAQVQGDA